MLDFLGWEGDVVVSNTYLVKLLLQGVGPTAGISGTLHTERLEYSREHDQRFIPEGEYISYGRHKVTLDEIVTFGM